MLGTRTCRHHQHHHLQPSASAIVMNLYYGSCRTRSSWNFCTHQHTKRIHSFCGCYPILDYSRCVSGISNIFFFVIHHHIFFLQKLVPLFFQCWIGAVDGRKHKRPESCAKSEVSLAIFVNILSEESLISANIEGIHTTSISHPLI